MVSQVGDASKDHACWERPEDMDTPRTVVKVDASNPGSDVAAETAAALAAASLVFRKADPAYASRLLARAKRVPELICFPCFASGAVLRVTLFLCY